MRGQAGASLTSPSCEWSPCVTVPGMESQSSFLPPNYASVKCPASRAGFVLACSLALLRFSQFLFQVLKAKMFTASFCSLRVGCSPGASLFKNTLATADPWRSHVSLTVMNQACNPSAAVASAREWQTQAQPGQPSEILSQK